MTPNAEPNSGHSAAGARVVRAIAVGNRLNRGAGATEERFVAELERIVGLASPHLAADRPNLTVLGEVLGLPLALAGPRGALARLAQRSTTALALLAAGYLPRIVYYRRRWPGTPLARALLLALTDTLYRPFVHTLARLAAAYGTHLVATTIVPHVHRSTHPPAIARFGRPGTQEVYLPTGPEVYNAAFIFGPEGDLLGRVDKVYLTTSEQTTLCLSSGQLDAVRAVPTSAGRLGVATSLDAFTPAYLRHLCAQGAEIVVQPDANDQSWAAPSRTCVWQPQEWLNSVLGCLQPTYPGLRFNVCAMQTGLFYDVVFDGQSTITAAASSTPPASPNFIGNDGFYDTTTGSPFLGKVLAMSDWVEDDPVVAEPALSLAERRRRLWATGARLLPGGRQAGQFRESVVWADLTL